MPSTQIEVRRPYSRADEVAVIDAVHDSLVAAFAIPPGDEHVRLVVHDPHRCATAPDTKRSLHRGIVDGLARVGSPGDHVTTVLRESATEDRGTRGGRAACDVDLGFDVHV
ncbi:hypothetical protein SAMN06893096_102237 [Geodermatophilus pulveris]|uniref:Tautomerase enzyme n=1 Tax=Geodermatophilus pulveris TaxID=1564159 RepID=A0A239C3Q8_9ACTN|nr:hypothetical protein [Geodermatophilus pulveris]SNS14915.1 hypothetical protein SAMN06893096_102237 [Geodermatophilus pulveris]